MDTEPQQSSITRNKPNDDIVSKTVPRSTPLRTKDFCALSTFLFWGYVLSTLLELCVIVLCLVLMTLEALKSNSAGTSAYFLVAAINSLVLPTAVSSILSHSSKLLKVSAISHAASAIVFIVGAIQIAVTKDNSLITNIPVKKIMIVVVVSACIQFHIFLTSLLYYRLYLADASSPIQGVSESRRRGEVIEIGSDGSSFDHIYFKDTSYIPSYEEESSQTTNTQGREQQSGDEANANKHVWQKDSSEKPENDKNSGENGNNGGDERKIQVTMSSGLKKNRDHKSPPAKDIKTSGESVAKEGSNRVISKSNKKANVASLPLRNEQDTRLPGGSDYYMGLQDSMVYFASLDTGAVPWKFEYPISHSSCAKCACDSSIHNFRKCRTETSATHRIHMPHSKL